jgi:hypothetical protein
MERSSSHFMRQVLAVLALGALVALASCSRSSPGAPVTPTGPRVPRPTAPPPPKKEQPLADVGTDASTAAAGVTWLNMPNGPQLPIKPAEAGDPVPPAESLWAPYPNVSKTYIVDAASARGRGPGVDLPDGTQGWVWETPDPPDKVRAWAEKSLSGWTIGGGAGDDGRTLYDLTPPSGPSAACILRGSDGGATYLVLLVIPPAPAASPDKPSQLSVADARERDLCLSNVRSLSMAMMMYAQDYDGEFPHAHWSDAAEGYTRNREILKCPADPSPPSYAFRGQARGKKTSAFKTPATEIMLYESDDDRTLVARHKGETVVSYIDGHAKAMPKSSVKLQPGMW